jgi:hypothetical protein
MNTISIQAGILSLPIFLGNRLYLFFLEMDHEGGW